MAEKLGWAVVQWVQCLLACTKPCTGPWHSLHRMYMEVNTCNPTTWEGEARESEIQSHSQLHRVVEANLGYWKPYLTKKEVMVEQEVFGEVTGTVLIAQYSVCDRW